MTRKDGGGQVTLTGDYTGASDATFDIKIVDTTISGTPKVSAPTFIGIGNGTMTAISGRRTALAAQEITVTLEDTGTSTAKAYAPFQGVTLRAKSSGTRATDHRQRRQFGLTFTPAPRSPFSTISAPARTNTSAMNGISARRSSMRI
jgi:hypothetical protein